MNCPGRLSQSGGAARERAVNWWPNARRATTGKSSRRGLAPGTARHGPDGWLPCGNASGLRSRSDFGEVGSLSAILRHSTPWNPRKPDEPHRKTDYRPPPVPFKPFPQPWPSGKCGTCLPAGRCGVRNAEWRNRAATVRACPERGRGGAGRSSVT